MNKVKVDSWEAALDELADERRLLLNTLANIIDLWNFQAPLERIDDAVKAAKITLINMNKKDV